MVIFRTRRRFHTAGNVYGIGPHPEDRVGYVFSIQTTSQNYSVSASCPLGTLPVCRMAGSTILTRRWVGGIEHKSRRRWILSQDSKRKIRSDAPGFKYRQRASQLGDHAGRFIAVKLYGIKLHSSAHFNYPGRIGGNKKSASLNTARKIRADFHGACYRYSSRTW